MHMGLPIRKVGFATAKPACVVQLRASESQCTRTAFHATVYTLGWMPQWAYTMFRCLTVDLVSTVCCVVDVSFQGAQPAHMHAEGQGK
jgi:hypothetical protein